MSRFFRQFMWWVRRRKREAELREEMEFHLEGDTEDREAFGVSPDEARWQAVREFGNLARVREDARSAWRWRLTEDLVQDLRYTFRAMRSSWGFSILAVGSLAVGIGANTALFSIVRTVLFAELSVPNPDELVTFQWVGPNDVRGNGRSYGFTVADSDGPAGSEFSLSTFEQLRSANRSLTDLAAFAPASGLSLVAAGNVDSVDGQYASGSYYEVLGIPAFRGRVITPADDTASAEPVVVLSHDYWERRFGSDPEVLGSVLSINGLSFTVIGVTPPDTPDPAGLGKARTAPTLTMPLAVEARLPKTNQTLSNRPAAWWLLLMGRLRPGVAPAEAAASFEPVFRRTVRDDWELGTARETQQTRSDDPRIPRLRIVSGAHGVYGVPTGGVVAIGIIAAIFAIVLVVVCVNLAGLLLSRMTARQQEITVRQAIGAARHRVIRQLLTENLVLALAGGTFGVLLAYWFLEFVPAWLPPDGGRSVGFGQMHPTVFAFAFGVALATVALFALVPALRASRAALVPRRDRHRLGSTRSGLSKGLLASEVALSLVLLVTAGLFIRTLENLRSVAVGFNPENVLVFRTDAPLAGYDAEESLVVYDRILEELRTIPGVEAAALSGFAPLTGLSRRVTVFFPGETEMVPVPTLNVHPEYFRTMEIPLLRGRGITAADGPDAPPVAVVNETFARRFLSGTEAVGSRFGSSAEESDRIEIVGVVADARFASLRDPAPPVFYTPHAQPGAGSSYRTFEVRTRVDPSDMIGTVWDAVRRVDPELPFFDASTYRGSIERTLIGERIFAAVTTLFGILAFALSMTGLFGLMSYRVARQTREIGIRMALGAERRAVLGAVIRESILLAAVGIGLGLAAVLVVTPLIGSLLFGLAPLDPATVATVVFLMLGVAALAGYLPARRASRVDPIVALRYE